MSDTTYNGWTNYETWLVNIWYDDAFTEEARDCAANADDRNGATHDLADIIKEYVEEYIGEEAAGPTGLVADLLNAAMREVNWDEIAEGYISDLDDDAFDNEEEE